MDLEQVLHVAPTAFANAYNMFDPRTGGAGGVFVLNNIVESDDVHLRNDGRHRECDGPRDRKAVRAISRPGAAATELQLPAVPIQPGYSPAHRHRTRSSTASPTWPPVVRAAKPRRRHRRCRPGPAAPPSDLPRCPCRRCCCPPKDHRDHAPGPHPGSRMHGAHLRDGVRVPRRQLAAAARHRGQRRGRDDLSRRARECRYAGVELARDDQRRRGRQRARHQHQGSARPGGRRRRARRAGARQRGRDGRPDQPPGIHASPTRTPPGRAGNGTTTRRRDHPAGPFVDLPVHRTDAGLAGRRGQRWRAGSDRRGDTQPQQRVHRSSGRHPATVGTTRRIRRRAERPARRCHRDADRVEPARRPGWPARSTS